MRPLSLVAVALALASVACGPEPVPSAPTRSQPAPPPVAQPPATQPPATQPPATQLPATQPAPTATEPPSAASSSVTWKLEVEPKSMTMAQRASCRIRITALNEGDEPGSPALHVAEWTLDGKPAMGLSLAFQNGARTTSDAERWQRLPPNDTVSDERAPCATLFPKPGHYVVGFDHGATHITAEVDVTP